MIVLSNIQTLDSLLDSEVSFPNQILQNSSLLTAMHCTDVLLADLFQVGSLVATMPEIPGHPSAISFFRVDKILH